MTAFNEDVAKREQKRREKKVAVFKVAKAPTEIIFYSISESRVQSSKERWNPRGP